VKKTAAAQIVNGIKTSRPKVEHHIFGYEDADDHSKFFWEFLGGKKTIKTAAEGGDDSQAIVAKKRLLKVSDASGSLKVTECTFAFKELHTDDVFIVDALDTIYVWIGKGATQQEKRSGVQLAQSYLNDQPDRNQKTPIVRIHQGNETDELMALFKS